MRPGPRVGYRWDEQTIAYAIELWHRRHLRTPTKSEWVRAGEHHPSTDTVLRVFGSWNSAIAGAGFRPRRRGEPKQRLRPRRWHRDSIVVAIRLWHRRHQRTPTKSDWQRAGHDRPCSATVLRVFGSWNTAIRVAGYTPWLPGSFPPRQRDRCARTGRFLPAETS